jgi:ketosteroid isomerase-like protein
MLSKIFVSLILLMSGSSIVHSQPSLGWKEEIQSVIMKQQEAWNRGDIEGYMQGYWKSDSLLFTSGGKIQRGWKATFEKYRKSYSTKAKMGKLSFSDLQINLLSPEAAWVFGRWELKREKDNPKGVFTLIFKKFLDGWKIVHDHTSASE